MNNNNIKLIDMDKIKCTIEELFDIEEIKQPKIKVTVGTYDECGNEIETDIFTYLYFTERVKAINHIVGLLKTQKDFLTEYHISSRHMFLSTYDESGASYVKVELSETKNDITFFLDIDEKFKRTINFYFKYR